MGNRVGLLLGLGGVLAGVICRAQTTAFTYQGRLSSAGQPSQGYYELQFSLYASDEGEVQLGGPLTKTCTTDSNGLFTATLDFGGDLFNGEALWLGIAVRTNGSTGPFTTLAPRQPLSATPYALTARTVTGPLNQAAVAEAIANSPITVTRSLEATNLSLPGVPNVLSYTVTTNFTTNEVTGVVTPVYATNAVLSGATLTNVSLAPAADRLAGRRMKCIWFGDSLTATNNGQLFPRNWPDYALSTPFFTNRVATWVVAATNGIRLSEIESGFDAALAANPLSPGDLGFVGIWIGANDGAIISLDPVAYSNRLDVLWQKARHAGYKAVAFTLHVMDNPTFGAPLYGPNDYGYRALSRMIRRAADRWDVLIDTEAVLFDPLDTEYYHTDGLHLAPKGKQKIAQYISAQLMTGGLNSVNDPPNPTIYKWKKHLPLRYAPYAPQFAFQADETSWPPGSAGGPLQWADTLRGQAGTHPRLYERVPYTMGWTTVVYSLLLRGGPGVTNGSISIVSNSELLNTNSSDVVVAHQVVAYVDNLSDMVYQHVRITNYWTDDLTPRQAWFGFYGPTPGQDLTNDFFLHDLQAEGVPP